MASQPRFLLLLSVLLVAASSAIAGCHRKGSGGCCGNGPCNIFCYNCDNGCNRKCESETCNSGEWAVCLGGRQLCGRICGREPGSQECEECLADSQETNNEICSKCYQYRGRKLMSLPSESAHQNCFNKLTECESACVLGMDTCKQCFGDSYDTCREELRPGDEVLAWVNTFNVTNIRA